jgi:hypothetical protein
MQNIHKIHKSWKLTAKKLSKGKNIEKNKESFLNETSSKKKKKKKSLLIVINFFTYFLFSIYLILFSIKYNYIFN